MFKYSRGMLCLLTFGLAVGASAEEMVLDTSDMDALTAGATTERRGGVAADAEATGARAFSTTDTLARAKAYQRPGAPGGLGTAFVNVYGTAFAKGDGEGASFSTSIAIENSQPGITAGRTRSFHRVGRHSSFSSVNSYSVTSWELDRHHDATRNLYRGGYMAPSP